MSTDTVQIYTVYINAPASTVWQAITTSDYTNRWGYGGDVEVDLQPGGTYRNLSTEQMRSFGMGDVAVNGTVLEVSEPTLLKLEWSPTWLPEAAPTVVTWELTEYPGGTTKVVLTHDLSAAPDTAPEFAGGSDPGSGGGGWPWALSDLKSLLETGAPMGDSAA